MRLLFDVLVYKRAPKCTVGKIAHSVNNLINGHLILKDRMQAHIFKGGAGLTCRMVHSRQIRPPKNRTTSFSPVVHKNFTMLDCMKQIDSSPQNCYTGITKIPDYERARP